MQSPRLPPRGEAAFTTFRLLYRDERSSRPGYERLARDKSRELELTLDHMNQGIMMVDGEQSVALMNRQVVNLLGLPEGLIGRRPKFHEVLGLRARRLELEISEQVFLQEEEANLTALQALRDLGVRIALDDFGTGQSSLSDICAFRLDKIKIDKSFVDGMASREDCASVVAALASLGRSLGIATTAEGVETAAQAELIRAAGCTQAQGYLYSRPLAAAAIAALLRETVVKRQVA